ncbi:MAG: beta-ketoacyl-[acyl-carrier-protein] synthase family protein [Armatimonadota bacterium]
MGPRKLHPSRRVVITGLGVISSSGIGREKFWDSVRHGRSGIRHITRFDASDLYCRIAAEIRDDEFDPADYMNRSEAKRSGRFVHFAMAAAEHAVVDAELDVTSVPRERKGAIFGTSVAGSGNVTDDIYRNYYERGPRACGVLDHLEVAPHATTSRVMIRYEMKGPSSSIATGCCSGLEAIALGANKLRAGAADVMVVGASEAVVSEFGMSLLNLVDIMTHRNEDPETAVRPYDATRDGIAVAEGGGAVVLETAQHAMDRGAPIFAEVLGYGCGTEGQHLAKADPSGEELAQALRHALDGSRIDPTEIDYVCAHGIGNVEYDIADMRAIKHVLGQRAYSVPISSIKGATGQPFAAGGSWQTVAACMTLQTGIIAPTINYHTPDPECDLDCVPNTARMARVDTVMLNSHSFGGTHSALIIRRFDEDRE